MANVETRRGAADEEFLRELPPALRRVAQLPSRERLAFDDDEDHRRKHSDRGPGKPRRRLRRRGGLRAASQAMAAEAATDE